jgi:eukaryotic-like serine/threonine-protein kinase
MIPGDPAGLDALLDEALARPAAERLTFVRREAAGRPVLREAAERILREAADDDPFLDPDGAGAVALRGAVLGADGEPHALAPGDTFAAYDVVKLAGRGGMGEVYRAVDRRLGRQVALKVLPHAFSDDPHRLARFEREARVLASLNHPNIGAIYGLAEDSGRQALVLEFVEGTSLAERLQSGPLPAPDALAIARQVALALECAHQCGVVHRDLKPANIVVTSEGTVKVLDFGLAKAAGGPASSPELTGVLTPGAVLGTPSYMAPEQAEGQAVDQRTDIWAFGCILFEMLTGARAFDGGTPGKALTQILSRPPDFQMLPPTTSEPIRRLLRRTLAADPGQRPADMSEVLGAIDRAARGAGVRRRAIIGTAAVAGVLLLAGIIAALPGPWPWRGARPAAVRFALPIPASEQLLPSGQPVAAISPDGRTLVYRAIRDGRAELFLRTLGELESQRLPGTVQGSGPFFSPDGAWVGFNGDGVLQRVSVAGGGGPVTICDAPGGANASWGGETIVFSTSTTRVLQRVAAGGGQPVPLTTLDREAGDLAHAFPHVLPRGDAALFTIVREGGAQVAVVRFGTADVRTLLAGSQPRYVHTGHLLFARGGTLWAVAFDDRRLALTGDPVPVLNDLDTTGGAAVHFSVSDNGTLVYAPRREEVPERTIAWVDFSGAESDAALPPGRYARAALAPDGARVALAASDGGNADIWIADLSGDGTLHRLTDEPAADTAPLWSPDGRRIVFRSDREGGGLFTRAVDGEGVERLTAAGDAIHTPHGFTPDGRTVLFTEFRSYNDQTIASVDLARPLRARTILALPGAQLRPQVSPDGRWLAYQSDETGRFEVSVRPYPGVGGGAWLISRGGGTSPRWSADGRRLFYYDGRGLSVVDIDATGAGQAPEIGPVTRLFEWSPFGGRLGPDYEIAPDGRRVLFIRHATDTPGSRVRLLVVQHWSTELEDLLAGR